MNPRPHRTQCLPEPLLDTLQRGGIVGLEAQHDDRCRVGRAGQAEAVGKFDAHAVDGDDFLGAVELAGIFLPLYRAFMIGIGALIIIGTALLVYRTRIGAMVRAAAFDRDMAASLGVPVQWVYAGAFAFGVSLAALAGVLLAPIYSVFPTMGRDFILMAFTVVIVGGMGSIAGAVVAGLFLTQVQAIASLYISPVWTDPIVFGIMVIMLMVRPQGLFGRLGHG